MVETIEELMAELKILQAKWEENLKSKHGAGGNSKDNQRAVEISGILREHNGNTKKE